MQTMNSKNVQRYVNARLQVKACQSLMESISDMANNAQQAKYRAEDVASLIYSSLTAEEMLAVRSELNKVDYH